MKHGLFRERFFQHPEEKNSKPFSKMLKEGRPLQVEQEKIVKN